MTPTPTHIKKRIDDLLAQMTLQEKLRQLGGYWFYELQTKGQLDQEKLKAKLKDGVGQITRIAGAGNLTPVETARTYNRIQKFLVEETRLGIPTINHEECCSGLTALGSTVYPQMIGLASTFQPELAKKMTEQIRKLGPLGLPQKVEEWDKEMAELEEKTKAAEAVPATA